MALSGSELGIDSARARGRCRNGRRSGRSSSIGFRAPAHFLLFSLLRFGARRLHRGHSAPSVRLPPLAVRPPPSCCGSELLAAAGIPGPGSQQTKARRNAPVKLHIHIGRGPAAKRVARTHASSNIPAWRWHMPIRWQMLSIYRRSRRCLAVSLLASRTPHRTSAGCSFAMLLSEARCSRLSG